MKYVRQTSGQSARQRRPESPRHLCVRQPMRSDGWMRSSEETGGFCKAVSGTDGASLPRYGPGSRGHGPDSGGRKKRCCLLLGAVCGPHRELFPPIVHWPRCGCGGTPCSRGQNSPPTTNPHLPGPGTETLESERFSAGGVLEVEVKGPRISGGAQSRQERPRDARTEGHTLAQGRELKASQNHSWTSRCDRGRETGPRAIGGGCVTPN